MSDRIGETRIMANGQKATIIAYRKADDIDIQFEDGTINEHKRYGAFLKGKIGNPNYHFINKHLGTSKLMDCGYVATIIKCNNTNDIVVQFNDENKTIKHCKVSNFTSGIVSNVSKAQRMKQYNDVIHNESIKKYKGMEFMNKNGQKMKIVEYINNDDVTVQFEDGTIVYHKFIGNVKRGEVQNPNFTLKDKVGFQQKEKYLNKTFENTYGEKFTVIEYNSYHNIVVEFENGYKKTTRAKCINTKKVYHPNSLRDSKIGMTNHNREGLLMTLIEYTNANHVVVQFEDGYKKNTAMKLFLNGTVNHFDPGQNLGSKWHSKYGLDCVVIEYNNKDDATVEFEDGTIVEHVRMKTVKKGYIQHPSFAYWFSNEPRYFKDFECAPIKGMVRGSYYHCNCNKCGFEGVMTAKEMLKHYNNNCQ